MRLDHWLAHPTNRRHAIVTSMVGTAILTVSAVVLVAILQADNGQPAFPSVVTTGAQTDVVRYPATAAAALASPTAGPESSVLGDSDTSTRFRPYPGTPSGARVHASAVGPDQARDALPTATPNLAAAPAQERRRASHSSWEDLPRITEADRYPNDDTGGDSPSDTRASSAASPASAGDLASSEGPRPDRTSSPAVSKGETREAESSSGSPYPTKRPAEPEASGADNSVPGRPARAAWPDQQRTSASAIAGSLKQVPCPVGVSVAGAVCYQPSPSSGQSAEDVPPPTAPLPRGSTPKPPIADSASTDTSSEERPCAPSREVGYKATGNTWADLMSYAVRQAQHCTKHHTSGRLADSPSPQPRRNSSSPSRQIESEDGDLSPGEPESADSLGDTSPPVGEP